MICVRWDALCRVLFCYDAFCVVLSCGVSWMCFDVLSCVVYSGVCVCFGCDVTLCCVVC